MRSSRAYKLSPLAVADMEDFWLYSFRNWSREQADSYHHDLVAAFQGLAAGVKTGRSVDVREGYFKYAVGSHFVFCRLSDSSLDVIRVLHQCMDTKRHL